ncbi:MAG: hypothetical protein ACOCQR_01570 [bacterium]
MINLTNREKIGILIAFFVAFGLLFYFYSYEPYTESTEKLEEELSSIQQKVSMAEIKTRKIPDLRKEYKQLQDKLNYSNVEVVITRKKLLQQVKKMTEKHDLKMVTFTPSGTQTINLKLNLRGTFGDLNNFLRNIMQWNSYMDFNHINIGAGDGEILAIDLTLTFYSSEDGEK